MFVKFSNPYVYFFNVGAVNSPSTTENVPSLNTEAEIREFLFSSPDTVWRSEYDIVKDLQTQITQNKCSEISDDAKEEIANLNYAERLCELQEKGEEFLRDNGYPEEQIDAIMDFDGSEAAIYRASPSMASSLVILDRSASNSQRKFTAKYVFTWSGVPALSFTDCATILSECYYYVDNSGSSTLYYRHPTVTDSYITNGKVVKMPKCFGHAAGVDIPLQQNRTINGASYPFHLSTGSLEATFNNKNGVVQSEVVGSYAHQTVKVTATPSISISVSKSGVSGAILLDIKLENYLKEMTRKELTVSVS